VARIVRKYGGSSLRETDQIKSAAKFIADLYNDGNEVVVVVSAMAATTDDLIVMANDLNNDPPVREMDMLLSVGERISCSLFAMALESLGVPAVSYTGSQVGIITDTCHGEARIVDVKPVRLLKALAEKQVVVVAGFQGVSIEKEITTLGRSGSDLTAVTLAAAIHADRCDLMKEVDGLKTAHPSVVEDAVVIETMSFESALKMARGGTSALQSEAARQAYDHSVTLGIGNSFTDQIGTIITDKPLDCAQIVGIARHDDLEMVRGMGDLPHRSGFNLVVELENRWTLWYKNKKNSKKSLYSGITVVTSGRTVDGLHKCIISTLQEADIKIVGLVESDSECWIGVNSIDADHAVRFLHNAFLSAGWMAKGSDS
jgi:aspartate kinase